MSILIAEDNMAQRHYLREILEKEFPSHVPVFEAADGEETVKLALGENFLRVFAEAERVARGLSKSISGNGSTRRIK